MNDHIWIFWTRDIEITIREAATQHITVDVDGDYTFRFSCIYAKCTRAERVELWDQIRALSNINIPGLVGGDFNMILRATEKRGGLAPDYGSIQDFHECLVHSNLSEIPYEGSEYT